jgi:hypothetical protein
MKKVFLSFSVLLLAAVMMVSCNKNSSKDVASTWLTSFYHMDYDAAKKVSTEDTKNLLSQLQQLTGMISDSSKKEMKNITVTVKDVKETGDSAVATYNTSDAPGKEQHLPMVKKDGKWLVQFTKNDQMSGADNAADQTPPVGGDSTGAAPATAPADATMQDSTKH